MGVEPARRDRRNNRPGRPVNVHISPVAGQEGGTGWQLVACGPDGSVGIILGATSGRSPAAARPRGERAIWGRAGAAVRLALRCGEGVSRMTGTLLKPGDEITVVVKSA